MESGPTRSSSMATECSIASTPVARSSLHATATTGPTACPNSARSLKLSQSTTFGLTAKPLGRVARRSRYQRVALLEDFAQDPDSLVASACKMKLEGIIGKRADAPYRSGRSTDWIKLKCLLRQEFVVAGFTRLRGAKTGVRSLMLGVYEADGSLRFAGPAQQNLRPTQLANL